MLAIMSSPHWRCIIANRQCEDETNAVLEFGEVLEYKMVYYFNYMRVHQLQLIN